MNQPSPSPLITIVLPCQNEEKGLPICLEQIHKAIKSYGLHAEVIVSDSSTDKSPQVAMAYGAKCIKHDTAGYGSAYIHALPHIQGTYIFMADADASYDFSEIPRFIQELERGYDMVIGNRFAGHMHIDAMTFSHRYIGNPILSGILRLFFKSSIQDSQCGMRAIRKDKLLSLHLQTKGMEFASEMIVKALHHKLHIKELPIAYHPRLGITKMRSFLDAWRHIRFMLLYSPLFLFFIPGSLLCFFGAITLLTLSTGIFLPSSTLFLYTVASLSSACTIVGYQLIVFSMFAKIYLVTHLGEQNTLIEKAFSYINIERALVVGGLTSLCGCILYIVCYMFPIGRTLGVSTWTGISTSMLTFVIIGVQTIFSSFMISILGIKEK